MERFQEIIKERIGWTDTKLLRALLKLIETQSWQARNDSAANGSLVDIKAAVDYIVQVFREPLESRGMCIATIQDELEEAVEYARQYLAIGTESYRAIWYKLHTSPNAGKWSNLLMLCELIFSLPFTTSRVEQMFTMLKTMKTKRRTSLYTTTLCDLMELNIEGSSLSEFSAKAAVDLWWRNCCTTRRVEPASVREYSARSRWR